MRNQKVIEEIKDEISCYNWHTKDELRIYVEGILFGVWLKTDDNDYEEISNAIQEYTTNEYDTYIVRC